ncbi:MAG: hypothetical protein M3O32_00175 [Actinomycetota bacterium]|nr:hypothetical protein [Actinomycetota bacterium]
MPKFHKPLPADDPPANEEHLMPRLTESGAPAQGAPPPVRVGPNTPLPNSAGDAHQGTHLVEALVDQLAAGQVESLYSLHGAASDVRASTAALAAAEAALRESCNHIASSVSRAAVAQVDTYLNDSLATLQSAIATAVHTLQEAAERLDERTRHTEATLRAAGDTTREQIHLSTDLLVEAGARFDQTVAGLESVGQVLIDGVAARAEDLFTRFRAEDEARQMRDGEIEERLRKRIDNVLTTASTKVDAVVDRLGDQAAVLAARDKEQETLRADALVIALEALMERKGGRGGLRDKIRDGLVAARVRREALGSAPDPAPSQVRATETASRAAGAVSLPHELPKAPAAARKVASSVKGAESSRRSALASPPAPKPPAAHPTQAKRPAAKTPAAKKAVAKTPAAKLPAPRARRATTAPEETP